METIKEIGPNLKPFYYHACEPSDASLVRGSVVVLHGAEGHGGRYASFGEELVKNGYAMFAIDHVGHGLTVREKYDDKGGWKKEDLGVWTKDDFDLSTYNAYYLVDVIRRKYPNKPVYLLGHDHGGSMAQYMMGKYEGAFDGIIISSCGMPTSRDKRVFFGAWLKKLCLYDGNKSKGTFKSRVRFLNGHFKPKRTDYDWMNSVEAEVDRFIEDPLSGYVGTIGYYYYQYKYIVQTPRFAKLKKVNRNLPLFILGGKEDYITKKGKSLEKLKLYYEKRGFTNIDLTLYDNSRHDVLLEWNKDKVAEDIAAFIDRNCYKEEPSVKKQEVVKVITLNSNEDAPVTPGVEKIEPIVSALKEEEPEDDLRLSTHLKNKD